MSEPITAIGACIGILNTFKGWAADLRQEATDEHNVLYENLALKIENKTLELEGKLQELAEENESLRQRCTVRGSVVFRDGFYHLSSLVQGLSSGPFCPLCWEQDEKLITIRHKYLDADHGTYRWCDRCDKRW